MTKANWVLFALALTLTACGGSKGESSKKIYDQNLNIKTTQQPPIEQTNSTIIPKGALTFDTNIQLLDVTSAQATKFERAREIIKSVIATEEFRSRILNHTYNGIKQFVDNIGLTNTQIYNRILDGAETLSPSRNNTMDIDVVLYTAATNVVGYTYPNVSKIWVNTKYFDTYTPARVAHNLMHEWLHKLGFGHDVAVTPSRPYSVPYAIGYIIADLGLEFL